MNLTIDHPSETCRYQTAVPVCICHHPTALHLTAGPHPCTAPSCACGCLQERTTDR